MKHTLAVTLRAMRRHLTRMLCVLLVTPCPYSAVAMSPWEPASHIIISYDSSGSMAERYIGKGTKEKLDALLLHLLLQSSVPDGREYPGLEFSCSDSFNISERLPLAQAESKLSFFQFSTRANDLISSAPFSEPALRSAMELRFKGDTDIELARKHAAMNCFGRNNEFRAYWIHVSDGKDDPEDPTRAKDLGVFLERNIEVDCEAKLAVPDGVDPVPGDKVPTTHVSIQIMELVSRAESPLPPSNVTVTPAAELGYTTLTWEIQNGLDVAVHVYRTREDGSTELLAIAPPGQKTITLELPSADGIKLVSVINNTPSEPTSIDIPEPPGEEAATARDANNVTTAAAPPPAPENPNATTNSDPPSPVGSSPAKGSVPSLDGLALEEPNAEGHRHLRWSAPSDPEVSIQVERSVDNGSTWETLVEGAPSITQGVALPSLNPGDEIRVQAERGEMSSESIVLQVPGPGGSILYVVVPLSALTAVAGGVVWLIRYMGKTVSFYLEQEGTHERSEVFTPTSKQRVFLGKGATLGSDLDLQWDPPNAPAYFLTVRGGEIRLGRVDESGDTLTELEIGTVELGQTIQIIGKNGQETQLRVVAATPEGEAAHDQNNASNDAKGDWDYGTPE